MRILIAEDDLTSRNMLKSVLQLSGHQVVETADGAEAWDEMRKSAAPKLVILDWMMPELDGLEVAKRIRALRYPQPPYIIMLTSKGKKNDIIAALDAGADDFLIKPFHVGELRARIDVGQRVVKIQKQLAAQVLELEQAMEQVKTLQGIIPICSFCKKIRNDQGDWDQVEVYVSKHSEAQFSHGVCSECVKKHYPEYAEEILKKEPA